MAHFWVVRVDLSHRREALSGAISIGSDAAGLFATQLRLAPHAFRVLVARIRSDVAEWASDFAGVRYSVLLARTKCDAFSCIRLCASLTAYGLVRVILAEGISLALILRNFAAGLAAYVALWIPHALTVAVARSCIIIHELTLLAARTG